MALINCSECGKEISSKAPTCPQCGAPVSDKATTTIQGTAKFLKFQQALSVILILAGMVGCMMAKEGPDMQADVTSAAYMILGGFAWFIMVRLAIWWKHS